MVWLLMLVDRFCGGDGIGWAEASTRSIKCAFKGLVPLINVGGGGDCPSEPQGKDLICQTCEQEFSPLSGTSTECTGCRT